MLSTIMFVFVFESFVTLSMMDEDRLVYANIMKSNQAVAQEINETQEINTSYRTANTEKKNIVLVFMKNLFFPLSLLLAHTLTGIQLLVRP